MKKMQVPQVESIFSYIKSASKSNDRREVVIGLSPTFGREVKRTICGLDHVDVIKELCAGIEEEGMTPRLVQVYKTADVAFIGKEVAALSGSGISIGIQAKGTTVIHHRDLYPLSNLELFPQAPLITLEMYRNIGKNAAKYAKGLVPTPIEVMSDFMTRPKYQVKAALMHMKDTERVNKFEESMEVALEGLR